MSKTAEFSVHSPGRINLIGEHVDYTGGLVLPASIDLGLRFDVRSIDESEWRLHATDLSQKFTLPLPITGRTSHLWVNYIAGIGTQFQEQGHLLPGLEITFGGNLPRGAGMSSSAALEGGVAFLLNEILEAGLSRPALAQLCQRSSNHFMGIPSGIMDQFASLNGRETGPILLDCHTLEHRPINNAIDDHELILVNSMVSHELSEGGYHDRVRECAQALEALQKKYPSITHLSATTQEQLDKVDLPPVVRQRAGFVVAENERVRQATTALETGNAPDFGELLTASHWDLSHNYEAACEETDFLVETATRLGGVAGGRQMGGGFGGCTLNLVKREALPRFKEELKKRYLAAYGIEPEFYPVHIGAGTHLRPRPTT